MRYFIGNYCPNNCRASNIDNLISWIKEQPYIILDTETKRKGLSPLKFDLHDTELVMLQIGNSIHQ
jgi:hypothetical protein